MQIRILLVDDEKSARDALSRVVAQLGYECLAAENATRALDALSSRPFELCVVSLGLPVETVRNVVASAHARKNAIPVVVRAAEGTVREVVSVWRLRPAALNRETSNVQLPTLNGQRSARLKVER